MDDPIDAHMERAQMRESSLQCLPSRRIAGQASDRVIDRAPIDLWKAVAVPLGLPGEEDPRQTRASCAPAI